MQVLYNFDTNEWGETYTLAFDVPASDGLAEVMIPEIPEIDETSLKLSQIKVSLGTIGENNDIQKRAIFLPVLARVAVFALRKTIKSAVTRYVIRKVKDKIKEEAKEVKRSAYLRLACQAWYKFGSRSVNRQSLPPCPCTKSQADNDDRYAKENILRDISTYYVHKKKEALGGCYSQSNVG